MFIVSSHFTVNFDHFQILRAIGKGSFGKVRSACIPRRNLWNSLDTFFRSALSKSGIAAAYTPWNMLVALPASFVELLAVS